MERIKHAIAKAHEAGATEPRGRPDVERQPPARPPAAFRTVAFSPQLLKQRRLVACDPSDPFCAPFDMLRTRIVQVMSENDWRTIAITSPNPKSGKTTTAINLALSMGRMHERKTILVDLDLRNPKVSQYLDIYNVKDISRWISGEIHLSDIMIRHESSNLYVIPNRTAVRQSSELIASKPMANAINQLKDDFPETLVLFDVPPMLAADDALALLPHMDAVILVAAAHQTSISDLNECEQKLKSANYLGVVLNKADATGASYRKYRY